MDTPFFNRPNTVRDSDCRGRPRSARQVERSPDFRSGREINIGRRNADHGERLAIQEQLLADETGIGAQVLLPESVS